jgi:hypothetical protein
MRQLGVIAYPSALVASVAVLLLRVGQSKRKLRIAVGPPYDERHVTESMQKLVDVHANILSP